MDQGIILGIKQIWSKKFLEEVMIILQDKDNEEDTRGQCTLQNLELQFKIDTFLILLQHGNK